MRILDILKAPEVKDHSVLTLKDHPLVRKAQSYVFASRVDVAAATVGYLTWGIHNLTAQTPEAVSVNLILGAGLVTSTFIATGRNLYNLSRMTADFRNSRLPQLPNP